MYIRMYIDEILYIGELGKGNLGNLQYPKPFSAQCDWT